MLCLLLQSFAFVLPISFISFSLDHYYASTCGVLYQLGSLVQGTLGSGETNVTFQDNRLGYGMLE
jgi:hypothetical protein